MNRQDNQLQFYTKKNNLLCFDEVNVLVFGFVGESKTFQITLV
jgi:hypothetical protein